MTNTDDPYVAQKVVAEYAALLEEHAKLDVYPASVESLPYPKDTIKHAVRTCVVALDRSGQLNPELTDFLEVAYVSLADYVEDELVRLMAEHRSAGAALAADGRLVSEKTASPAWHTLAETSRLVGEVARNIAAESEALRHEFRELHRDSGTQ
jgi:hypothetical protein